MAKVKTNVFEIILKNILIGKTITIKGEDVLIENVNYDPNLRVTHITNGTNRYKLTQNEYFDFDFNQIGLGVNTRVLVGKRKIV
jgi:hypothetical protein